MLCKTAVVETAHCKVCASNQDLSCTRTEVANVALLLCMCNNVAVMLLLLGCQHTQVNSYISERCESEFESPVLPEIEGELLQSLMKWLQDMPGVCMYVCVRARVCVCVHVSVRASVCASVHVCVRIIVSC